MRNLVVSVLFIFSLILVTPNNAQAQGECTVASYTEDQSVLGLLKLLAETNETSTDCDTYNYATQTEAWIVGYPQEISCLAGTLSGDGQVCYQFRNIAGSAVAPIAAGCGNWDGRSRHWGINPEGDWQHLNGGNDLLTELRAGLCKQFSNPVSGQCNNWEMWDESTGQCIPYNTPIIIPTRNAQSYALTNAANGVSFDFRGNGVVTRTGWTAPNSGLAFLAYDRNNNGVIDNGTELFGNHTVAGAANGFEALAKLNKELGGGDVAIIDAEQPLFNALLLWEDVNHNGISELNELRPASELISGVGLGLIGHMRRDGHGNMFAFRGFAHKRTGAGKNPVTSRQDDRVRQINIYDVVFTSR